MPHVNAKVTAVPATALGMPAAAAALPRKWEGVDPALERMVLRACLDQAPERRRVREAFKGVQLSIDHCLFKVRPFLFFPSLSSKVLFVIGQPGFNSQRYPYHANLDVFLDDSDFSGHVYVLFGRACLRIV
jgi:hypothetical protein